LEERIQVVERHELMGKSTKVCYIAFEQSIGFIKKLYIQ